MSVCICVPTRNKCSQQNGKCQGKTDKKDIFFVCLINCCTLKADTQVEVAHSSILINFQSGIEKKEMRLGSLLQTITLWDFGLEPLQLTLLRVHYRRHVQEMFRKHQYIFLIFLEIFHSHICELTIHFSQMLFDCLRKHKRPIHRKMVIANYCKETASIYC